MILSDNCSVIKEISKVDDAIKTCYERVAALERKLEENVLSAEKQTVVRKELDEVQKLLKTNEDLLRKLHGHNRKSFMIAVFIAFIFFMFYIFYKLASGTDFS